MVKISQERQKKIGVKIGNNFFSKLSIKNSNNFVIDYLRNYDFILQNFSAQESGPWGRNSKQRKREQKSRDTVPLS